MNRRACKPFTFSDGTVIPSNAFVSVAADFIHRSGDHYTDPDKFDGFRFVDSEGDEREGHQLQIVTLGTNHMPFGNGRHACPGRFFAANELKAMLAHVLMSYDVKFETDDVGPFGERFGAGCLPKKSLKVMFRKRQI